MFTTVKVEMGLRLAMLGEKDRARDIARFVRNARIVEILKPHSGELLIDAPFLEWKLRELERACHPLSPALSALDKFSQILARLDLIAGHVANLGMDSRVSACDLCGAQKSASARRSHPQSNSRFSVEASRQDVRHGVAVSGPRFASKDTQRNFPVVIAPGRFGNEAKPTTLRLRVRGLNLQATKEPKQ